MVAVACGGAGVAVAGTVVEVGGTVVGVAGTGVLVAGAAVLTVATGVEVAALVDVGGRGVGLACTTGVVGNGVLVGAGITVGGTEVAVGAEAVDPPMCRLICSAERALVNIATSSMAPWRYMSGVPPIRPDRLSAVTLAGRSVLLPTTWPFR